MSAALAWLPATAVGVPEVEQPIRCADGTDPRDADDLRLALSRYDDGVGEDGHVTLEHEHGTTGRRQ